MYMRKNSSQTGLGHVVALALVVLVFAIIGFIGYTLYAKPMNNKGSDTSNTVRDTTTTLNNPAAPEIKTASDLDKASAVLEEVDPGSENQKDESTLDSQLNSF